MRTTDLVPLLVEKIGRAGPTYPPRRTDKHVPEQQAESTPEPNSTLIKGYTCVQLTLCPYLLRKYGRAGPTYPPRRTDKNVPEQQAESTPETIYTLIKAVGGLNESPNQSLQDTHAYN